MNNTDKMKRTLIIGLLAFLIHCTNGLNAAHIIGGFMSYECTESDASFSRFAISMDMFRDKYSDGANFDSPAMIGIYRTLDGVEYEYHNSFNVNVGVIEDFVYQDPFATDPIDFVVQWGEYDFDIVIPNDGYTYLIAYQRCCRQVSYVNILNSEEAGYAMQLELTPKAHIAGSRSVNMREVVQPYALPNASYAIEFPFEESSTFETRYELINPFTSGGVVDANTGGSLMCCECVRPSAQACLPPFPQQEFVSGYSKDMPFGQGNEIEFDDENAAFTGRFKESGHYLYSIRVTQMLDGEVVSRHFLDFAIFVTYQPALSLIRGNVFLDQNENGIKDDMEETVEFKYLEASPMPYSVTYWPDEFLMAVEPGEYTVGITNEVQAWEITNNDAVVVDDVGQAVQHDVGINAAYDFQEAEISLASEVVLCNTNITMSINIDNKGTIPFKGSLIIYPDSLLEFRFADIPTLEANQDSIVLAIDEEIDILDSRVVEISFRVASEDFVGEIIDVEARIVNEDGSPSSTDILKEELRCAVDPNDKLSYSDDHHFYLLYDKPLHYTIRFENTGNYPAQDVFIIDDISEDLDINTLRIKSSSHPMNYKIQGNNVRFNFDDIMLPPSETAGAEGHGYVRFSIYPIEGLDDFTELTNEADIYFDANSPIRTNLTINELVSDIPIDPTETTNSRNPINLRIAPNPNNGQFVLYDGDNLLSQESNIKVFNYLGQEVYKGAVEGIHNVNINEHPGLYSVKLYNDDFTRLLATSTFIVN